MNSHTKITPVPLGARDISSISNETAVLSAKGIEKSFGGQKVLANVSLQLQQGEVVLLRGANGSGKTTLLNILTGYLRPDCGNIQLSLIEGRANYEFSHSKNKPKFTSKFSPEHLSRKGVGRSWQEIRLFSSQRLRDNIAVAVQHQSGENPLQALFNFRLVHQQEEALQSDVGTTLTELGLQDRENSSADMVSLGQAKRVAIARAVAAGAKILFLDEPLAGLDAAGINEIVRFLENLAREQQLSLVIVEHVSNISRIAGFVSTVWTLEKGKLKVEQPNSLCRQAEPLSVFNSKLTTTKKPLPGGAVLISQSGEAEEGKVLLTIENLVVEKGGRAIIGSNSSEEESGLSFQIRRGELLVLQAPNGWGKTTLLEAIAGLVPTKDGSVNLRGCSIEKLPVWERSRRGISLLQARDHSFPGLTVREAIRVAGVRDYPQMLEPFLHRRVSDLSGGEKQRVALVCAQNSPGVRVLLLDEPFSALDAEALHQTQEQIEACLPNCAVLIALPSAHNEHLRTDIE